MHCITWSLVTIQLTSCCYFLKIDSVQDAVKYLENRVQNVGDSVKKFYSDVVQDLLPLPALVNSAKNEAHSVPLENNIGSSIKAAADVEDNNNNNNKKGDEENPGNNFIESLLDSNAIDHAEDHQALVSIEHDPVNQVNYENYSDSLELEDSYLTKEVVDDDHSREASGAQKENLYASTEMMAVQSPPQPMNLISFKQEEPLQFSIGSQSCPGCSNSGCGGSVREKDKLDVDVEQNTCSIVERNAADSCTSQVLNFKSLGEKESFEASLIGELSDVFYQETRGVLAEVSPPASAMSGEGPRTKMEPFCSKSSLVSDSLYSKSQGSYSFENESCKNNSGDVSWCFSDSSMVRVCCEPSSPVAGQIMESQDGLVSSGRSQTMQSNGWYLHLFIYENFSFIPCITGFGYIWIAIWRDFQGQRSTVFG